METRTLALGYVTINEGTVYANGKARLHVVRGLYTQIKANIPEGYRISDIKSIPVDKAELLDSKEGYIVVNFPEEIDELKVYVELKPSAPSDSESSPRQCQPS